jgi:ubiquinone/menaquinone biosynthesis C-methylase UbiE
MIVRRDELISGQYFVAIAGVAAMRHILLAPSDVMPRLEDARRVIEALDEFPNNIRIPVVECDVIEGYDAWAPVYDSGPNAATERDSEVVRDLLATVPHVPVRRNRALDAACGTGRQSLLLAELGYEVEGVDLNETMLAIARERVPAGHFVQGRLDAIPHDDASFDVAVCSLALTHIPELRPGLAELARVVKPGGYAVISDIHPVAVHLGISAGFRAPDITQGIVQVPNLLHEVSEYVNGFLATGWEVCDCVEPMMPESALSGHPAYSVLPDAVRGAFEGLPFLLAWKLRRRSD